MKAVADQDERVGTIACTPLTEKAEELLQTTLLSTTQAIHLIQEYSHTVRLAITEPLLDTAMLQERQNCLLKCNTTSRVACIEFT